MRNNQKKTQKQPLKNPESKKNVENIALRSLLQGLVETSKELESILAKSPRIFSSNYNSTSSDLNHALMI